MKAFLSKKTLTWYFSCASMLLALAGLIIYLVRGGNDYSPVSTIAAAVWGVGVALNVLVLIKDFKIGAFVPYILYTVTFGILLNTEMLFASNVLVGIDGQVFDVAWCAFVACLALAIIAGIVGCAKELSKE